MPIPNFAQQQLPPIPGAQPNDGMLQAWRSSGLPLEQFMQQWQQSHGMGPQGDLASLAGAGAAYGGGIPGEIGRAKSGMQMDDMSAINPNTMGFKQAMDQGLGMGQAVKQLPYDLKRGFQGKNLIGTGIGAATGAAVGSGGSGPQQALSAAGGTIGAALGTMIPIPIVGQAIGGLVGSEAGKLLGGLFGGGEDEAKKKAEKASKVDALRQNLNRLSQMYTGGRNG